MQRFNLIVGGYCVCAALEAAFAGIAWLVLMNAALAALNLTVGFRR